MADWRPMTDLEHRAALALQGVTYPVASPPKRFARHLGSQCSTKTITDKQANLMWYYCHRFRRQIVDKDVLAEAHKWKDSECS